MKPRKISAIKKSLESEANKLEEREACLNRELEAIQSDANRVKAAIEALDGIAQNSSKEPTKRSRKRGLPAPTRAEVIRCMTAILTDNPVLEADELKELIQDKLGEDGFSKNGFSLRFKEALAGEDFVETPAGLRIKSKEPAHV